MKVEAYKTQKCKKQSISSSLYFAHPLDLKPQIAAPKIQLSIFLQLNQHYKCSLNFVYIENPNIKDLLRYPYLK